MEEKFRINDNFIESMFRDERRKLEHLACAVLQRYHVEYIDPKGRAEDVVQETFYFACQKRNDIIGMEAPKKWLTAVLMLKVREAVREDRKWIKTLMLLPTEETEVPFPEMDALSGLIPAEDYALLRRMYVEGYTYEEICQELGIRKSQLRMKVYRIKKTFRKNHPNFRDQA